MQSKLLADEYLSVASEFVGRDQVEAIRCVSCTLQRVARSARCSTPTAALAYLPIRMWKPITNTSRGG